jgi:hypothetical protein
MNRHLPILALLALLFPVFSHAQALADAARETRAEEQTNAVPRAKVITNEDIAEPAPAHKIDASSGAQERDAATKDGEAATRSSTAAAKAQEPETQQHAAEIDKHYLDRIATLRDQINSAQLELGKLEGDRLEAGNGFTRADTPNFARYEAQMYSLNDQIEAKRSLITNLKARLEDAREAARRAGVPKSADDAAEPEKATSSTSPRTDSAEDWEARQLEAQQRTAAINKGYLDRIATLRSQIDTAQQELAKLQGKPVEGPTEFGRTVASVPFWEMQVTQTELSEEIEAQQSLIASLQAQLETAQEEARRAGVPHATD